MEKIINRLIDEAVVDVDKYVNNNSTWLIFTESKQWVIELTKDGTLWYNYNFFKNLFVYMSMDVVENQHYITKWVEDNIINGVKDTKDNPFDFTTSNSVEDALQNGVKIKPALESHEGFMMGTPYVDKFFSKEDVEDTVINGVKEAKPMEGWVNSQKIVDKTIQNGVKETHSGCDLLINDSIQDTLKNGVKETELHKGVRPLSVNNTIQNGVKETRWMSDWLDNKVENTIQNGVKHTIDTTHHKNKYVEDAIENGVKETLSNFISSDVCVEDIIQNGIKETKGGGYLGSITQYVNDVIENSTKEKL